MALSCLIDMIETPSPQLRQICLKTDLVVRNSCRALESGMAPQARSSKGPGTEENINRLTVKKGDEK
jgi:hypothetical protein